MIGLSCRKWFCRSSLAASLLLLNSQFVPPAVAQDDLLGQSALALVPDDAAFFSSSLNMGEAYEEWNESRLVQRMRATPFIQRLEAEFRKQWDNPEGELSQAKAVLESPNAVNVLKLASEMASTEMFIYGGDDWCDTIESFMAFQREISQLAGQGPEAMEDYFASLVPEDLDEVRVPTTVIGFRIADDDNARQLLDALEGIVRYGLGSVDEVAPFIKRLKRADFNDGQSLSLTLDSTLIPIDEVPEEQQELVEHLMELIEGRKVTIAMGIKGERVLIAIGEEAALLQQFGSDGSRLLDHDALALLKEQPPEKLRAVAYQSQRWRESQWNANFGTYFENIAAQFSAALASQAEEMPELEAWREEIEGDAQWLDEKLGELAPEFGPIAAWSYAVDEGLEGIAYDWSDNVMTENAQPLDIIDHAGAKPLVVVGVKQRNVVGVREIVEALLDKGPGHIRRFISLAEQDEEEREKALMVLDRAWPMLESVYNIYRDKIIPSLEDGQSVFAIAADWQVSELPEMPALSQPLPLPEMAFACTLTNRELFLTGCSEIYDVFDQVVELLRDIEPDSVPEGYIVPRPDEETLASGTRYFYSALSEQVPLEGFEPQILVGDDLLVFGYSMRQVDEMLLEQEESPLSAPWLEADSPVATVSFLDAAAITRMIRPWAEFGFEVSGIGLDTPLSDENGPIPTGNDLLQIWDTLTELGEFVATTSVDEEGTTVTRWLWKVGE